MMSVQNELNPIPPSFFWMQPPGERRSSEVLTSPVDVKSESPRGRRLSEFSDRGRGSVSPRRLGPNEDGEDEFVIHPRRKAGQDTTDSKGPVVLTRSILESYFDLPLINAAAEMGLSCTALKKVCRKMGISNWPYRFRDELCRSPGSLSRGSSPARSPTSPLSPATSPRYRPGANVPVQQRLQSAIPDVPDELPPVELTMPEHGFRSTSRRRPQLTSSASLPDLAGSAAAQMSSVSLHTPPRAPLHLGASQPPRADPHDAFGAPPSSAFTTHHRPHQQMVRSSSFNGMWHDHGTAASAMSGHPEQQQHEQADVGQFGNFIAPRYAASQQSPYEQQQHGHPAAASAAWQAEDIARSTADLSHLALRENHGGGGGFSPVNNMSHELAAHPADHAHFALHDKQWGQLNSGFAPEATAADLHPAASLSVHHHPAPAMDFGHGGIHDWGEAPQFTFAGHTN